jgi:proteasome activator subunit 4
MPSRRSHRRAQLTYSTITKMLYTVVMRYLCLTVDKPEERLFLQEPSDPFTKTIELTDTSDAFLQSYFQSFKEPPPTDGSQAMMQDRSDTGWLVWGKTMEVSRMTGPDEDAFCMDETSTEGVAVIREVMTAPTFWQTVSQMDGTWG